jgi:hypothetical protein
MCPEEMKVREEPWGLPSLQQGDSSPLKHRMQSGETATVLMGIATSLTCSLSLSQGHPGSTLWQVHYWWCNILWNQC